MKLSAFETIIQALHNAQVQYLVVGGVAVNAHGYIRFTPDIDLSVELNQSNIRKACRALTSINYHPGIPSNVAMFSYSNQHPPAIAQPEIRLLTFHNDGRQLCPVKFLINSGLDFSREYDRAMRGEILPGVEVRFLSIPALIRLKHTVDRLRDRDDIQHLQWLEEDYSHIGENDEDFLWSMTSFDGSRKMQLIRAKKLSVRQRLEGLDDLREVCERLYKMQRVSI